jgi:DNA-binding protein YbaB
MSIDEQIEQLMAEYREQRDRVSDVQRRITEVSTTVTAPRQVVEVTVNGPGEVTAIAFPTGAYRRMAPKELAGVLVTTLAEARAASVAAVARLVSEHLPAGGIPAGFLSGGGRVSEVDGGPPMPDLVREYLTNGRPSAG